jgi:hypothetical protein
VRSAPDMPFSKYMVAANGLGGYTGPTGDVPCLPVLLPSHYRSES